MGFGDVEPGFRSGFVALVGRPTPASLTLLNACYGKKVAITSPVAQTTRRRMRAVVNRPGYQLVFVDTPGIHKPKDGLGSELNKSALFELNDVDVVAFLIDATKPIGRETPGLPSASRAPVPKGPGAHEGRRGRSRPGYGTAQGRSRAYGIRRRDRDVVGQELQRRCVYRDRRSLFARGPALVPRGHGHHASDETLVAEFVREKVLRRTRDEIPHSVGVICDALEQTKKVLRVHATIYVEREGQRASSSARAAR